MTGIQHCLVLLISGMWGSECNSALRISKQWPGHVQATARPWPHHLQEELLQEDLLQEQLLQEDLLLEELLQEDLLAVRAQARRVQVSCSQSCGMRCAC